MKRFSYAIAISLFAASPVAAQVYTGPYGGPNYVPNNVPQYGIYRNLNPNGINTPMGTYNQPPAPTSYTPQLPQVPHVQGYVPAPYNGR